MADLYQGVPGVRNTIVNEPLSTPLVDDTADALFIIGTAEAGPLYTPIKPAEGQAAVEAQFGKFTLNSYSHRSVLKAYYEALAAGGGDPNFNVRLIRVGNVASPAIDLYEYTGAGVNAGQDGELNVALHLEYNTPGLKGNGSTVEVTGDASGIPTSITITPDDGTTPKTFYLDPTGLIDGYIHNVAELVTAIANDADLAAAGIVPSTKFLEKEVEFTYATPIVDMSADGLDYGNNIVDIASAYSYSNRVETIQNGLSSVILTEVPEKDFEGATPTITSFYGVKNNVLEKTIAVDLVGVNKFVLSCMTDSTRLPSGEILVTSARIDRGAQRFTFTSGQVSINTASGEITFSAQSGFTNFELGDKVYVTYKYQLGYNEADVRSQLVIGSRSSYFVSGDSLVFGAAQIVPIEVAYRGKREYQWGSDIILLDRLTSKVMFSRADNIPLAGDTVIFNVRYLPELPAPSGATLADGVTTQLSSFTGGNNGISMSIDEYKKEVAKGLELTFGYPCAAIVVAGAYLDDVTTGYNYETGHKEQTSVNWHGMLSEYGIKKSTYVSECRTFLPVKPLQNRDAVSVSEYVDRLMNVNSADPYRPANLINLIDAYNLTITANDFVVAVPQVLSTDVYSTPAATIYAVTSLLQSKSVSPINTARKMPDCVRAVSIPPQSWDTMNQLNQMRYTFFQRDNLSGFVLPADAPTLANYGSSLDRQYVVDIMFMCMKALRSVLQPFIGKANDARTRTVMENMAKSTLAKYTPEFIRAYDVKITADERDKIDGNTKVKYIISTSREIRTISQETRIKLV